MVKNKYNFLNISTALYMNAFKNCYNFLILNCLLIIENQPFFRQISKKTLISTEKDTKGQNPVD